MNFAEWEDLGKMYWKEEGKTEKKLKKSLACTAWPSAASLSNDECHLWIRPKLSQQPQMSPYQRLKG